MRRIQTRARGGRRFKKKQRIDSLNGIMSNWTTKVGKKRGKTSQMFIRMLSRFYKSFVELIVEGLVDLFYYCIKGTS